MGSRHYRALTPAERHTYAEVFLGDIAEWVADLIADGCYVGISITSGGALSVTCLLDDHKHRIYVERDMEVDEVAEEFNDLRRAIGARARGKASD